MMLFRATSVGRNRVTARSFSSISTPLLSIRQFSTSVQRNIELDVMQQHSVDRKTKIVCTAGPSSSTRQQLKDLLIAGMNVMRLNFSHGNHSEKAEIIANLRQELSAFRTHVDQMDFSDGSREDFCVIAADIKGPKIRTGWFSDCGEVMLTQDQELVLTCDSNFIKKGTADKIYVDYAPLPQQISPGEKIFLNDGAISLSCVSTNPETNEVVTRVESRDVVLKSRKGVNIPDVKKLDLPALTETDHIDIKFCVEQNVDVIFASFMRKAEDVESIRDSVWNARRELGIADDDSDRVFPLVISKIESQEGIRNFDEILSASDGIMVARGDLGIEIPAEKVFLAQKMMIGKCNVVGKPVICATQMLETMIDSPIPTRAECSDVANAVMDGSDMVMLSGETAAGKYPLEAVEMMSKICLQAEEASDSRIWSRQIFQTRFWTDFAKKMKDKAIGNLEQSMYTKIQQTRALARSAVQFSFESRAAALIVLSESGFTAGRISSGKPTCPIFCVTSSPTVARRSSMYRGVQPILIKEEVNADHNKAINSALGMTKFMNVCKDGDSVIVVRTADGENPTISVVTVSPEQTRELGLKSIKRV